MARQSLMWTTLPNGWTEDGRGVRVSILLSPRLDAEDDPEQLASFFPDWEDWPATLAEAVFHVTYGGATVAVPATQTAGPTRVDTTLGVADSTVWNALFHGGLFVRGFKFKNLSKSHVVSYDTVAVAGLVQDLYGKLASAADGNMPLVSDFVDDPDWQELVETVGTFDGRTTDERTGLRDPARLYELFRAGALPLTGRRMKDLELLQLFHTPPQKPRPVTHERTDDKRVSASWLEYEREELPEKEELGKQLDFHQIVAAMNAYPTLLRRLGIVVDLVIARDRIDPAADALLSTTVEIPSLRVTRDPDVSPVTHARFTENAFTAVPNPFVKGYRVLDGLLDLDPHRFALLQADVDGAGLKLMGFARSLGRLGPDDERVDPTTRFEKELGAPSLRTAGLTLVQRGRGAMLKDRFAGNSAKNELAEKNFQGKTAAPPELWAEDLVRGFRFDVWDRTTNLWRSLCRREATYELAGGAVVVTPEAQEEEGTVRLGATCSPDPTTNADIVHLHEMVVAWTGWSLAAPQPGRAILPGDEVDKTAAQTEAELPPGLDFRSRFRPVRGSLPRLRFGREYWLRARAVDLAGNSLPPTPESFGPEKPEQNAQPFLRYEPVAAPVIALVKREDGTTEVPAEGESMQRIAIRSFNDTPADNEIPTPETARRFAVPPQVSAKEAEQHGMLDAGGKLDPATFNLLADQDRDAKDPAAALIEEKIPLQGPLDPGPVEETTFAVYRDGHDLTYLPDPLAEVVAARIFGHPAFPDTEIIPIPLYPEGTWPNAVPFKIAVFEAPGEIPSYDAESHTLLVPLAKADRATVRLSMRLRKRTLHEKMGIWRWLTDAAQAALEPLALEGQHWMLTPWRTVELVHATQRPLITPEIVKLALLRGLRETAVLPTFVATCSLKSTDRLDLLAEWHEPVDDDAVPADRQRNDVAFAVKVTDKSSYATKLDGHPRGGLPEHAVVGDDLIEVGPGRDLIQRKRHEFNDTRYRRIEYWLEGTTRFREYLPADLQADESNIKVFGPRTVAWVPNAAPPPAPEILYVVPTFGWVRSMDGEGNAASWRRGGGLRVYLNREWNVSGYGEMLAVVLPRAGFAQDPDALPVGRSYRKYVTQWGNDPLWDTPFVPGLAPQRSGFPLARTQADPAGAWLPPGAPPAEADQPPGPFQVTGLLPPGVAAFPGDATVEIAPHDVFYDEERRLWYCDIEIDQGSTYWPFIRLALARYQPVSVRDAHLSEVVLADFMPLTADRWLNVKRTRDRRTRHVTVFGHSYFDSSAHREAANAPSMSLLDPLTGTVETLEPVDVAKTTVLELWVERLDPARGEDFGWERVSGATVRPARSLAADLDDDPAPGPAFRFVTGEKIAHALDLQRHRKFHELVTEPVDTILSLLTLWEGDVTLPAEPGEGERYRLVIAEFEEYLVDDDRPYDRVPTRKARRLVFVEHVELSER